jgi:hypothetical protein
MLTNTINSSAFDKQPRFSDRFQKTLGVIQSVALYPHLREVSWVIETHSAQLEKDCVDLLSTYGFRTQIVKQAWWRCLIPERRLLTHNHWLVVRK